MLQKIADLVSVFLFRGEIFIKNRAETIEKIKRFKDIDFLIRKRKILITKNLTDERKRDIKIAQDLEIKTLELEKDIIDSKMSDLSEEDFNIVTDLLVYVKEKAINELQKELGLSRNTIYRRRNRLIDSFEKILD